MVQCHELTLRQTSDVAVMCQIEPSPRDRTKSKKKTKNVCPSLLCDRFEFKELYYYSVLVIFVNTGICSDMIS